MKTQVKRSKLAAKTTKQDEWIPTLCTVCNRGPDMIRVHVVDGKAVEIEGNQDFTEHSLNHGRLCAKAYGILQKLYNPHRIKAPLKRTNPKKGYDQDPGFVEISWDEALDICAEKLKAVHQKNPNGLNVGIGGPQATSLGRSALVAFKQAFGTRNALGGGGGIRCTQGEHIFGNLWHGAFTCEPDLNHCNYLIIFGRNQMASGGVSENYQFESAKDRGMKIVVIDPRLSLTAAKGDKWIPIRPGTDSALMLSMIQVILNEIGKWDEPFLCKMTNSPYLVGKDGLFLRDEKGNILVWDKTSRQAVPLEPNDGKQPERLALLGTYQVNGKEVRPAFQVLKDHVTQYTPEWAEKVTEVRASTIRELARDWVENAQIGKTITFDGKEFPYRPVAAKLGRGINAVMRAYQCILANHILSALMGAMEVPGGHWGGRARMEGASHGIHPGKDGMLAFQDAEFEWPPKTVDASGTFMPYSITHGTLTHLAYLNMANPDKLGTPKIEAYIRWRSNPMMSIGDFKIMEQAAQNIPFFVSFAYVMDEDSWLADIVLPDNTDLEHMELTPQEMSIGTKSSGYILRQPVTEPLHNTRDVGDVMAELAERVGVLDKYNQTLGRMSRLNKQYALEPTRRYTWLEIQERAALSVTNGEKDLEWFKEHGGFVAPVPPREQYEVHDEMLAKKTRYPLPYQEHVLKTGRDLKKNLEKIGIEWWDTSEYVALPEYFPPILDIEPPPEYDLYCTTYNSPVLAWGNDVELPWLIELAEHERGLVKVVMNPKTAASKGLQEGNEVIVESETGKTQGKLSLSQGIRPDTIGIAKIFGHPITPLARDCHWPSHDAISPISWNRTDKVVGCMQGTVQKVKVCKAR